MRPIPLLLACLLLPGWLLASPEEGLPPLRSWTEGEAGGQNWQVRQLPNRVLAFANRSGVLLFDGERFEQAEVPGGIVYDFAVGAQQRLYVASGSALGYLQPDALRRWEFVPLSPPADAPPAGDIGRVVVAHGRSFFLSRTLVLSHHPQRGWRWRAAQTLYSELRLREDRLLLHEDGGGWLAFDPAREEFVATEEPGFPANGLATTSEQPGDPWYASDRRALYRRQDGRWSRFDVAAPAGWQDDRIEALARLPNGDVAVGTRFGGLYQFSASGALVRRVAAALLRVAASATSRSMPRARCGWRWTAASCAWSRTTA